MFRFIKKLATFLLANLAYFLGTSVVLGLLQVALDYGSQKLYLSMFIFGALWTLFAKYFWKWLD